MEVLFTEAKNGFIMFGSPCKKDASILITVIIPDMVAEVLRFAKNGENMKILEHGRWKMDMTRALHTGNAPLTI